MPTPAAFARTQKRLAGEPPYSRIESWFFEGHEVEQEQGDAFLRVRRRDDGAPDGVFSEDTRADAGSSSDPWFDRDAARPPKPRETIPAYTLNLDALFFNP